MNFEKVYGNSTKLLFELINPIKKIFITTECQVHLFNNIQAIRLLHDYNFLKEYRFIKVFLKPFQKGSIWADQNFKSINHFYNPKNKKGLFGQSNALNLTKSYYNNAIYYYLNNDIPKSIFYLGACIHIIQDLTIPQHVRIRLLDHHRSYESFVKYTFDLVKEYRSIDPPIIFNKITDYINFNAKIALRIDKAYKNVIPLKIRYFKMTLSSLPLAQSTSAGCIILFFNDIKQYLSNTIQP